MGKTAYEMPPDFSALYRVWADGRITRALRWRAGKLLVPEGYAAEIVVEYFAVPNTIPQDDLVMDYGAMLQMYNYQASLLRTTQPGENRRIAQSLFRG